MSPRRRALLGLVIGLVLGVAGAAVLVLVPVTSFGWFAYAPLSDATFAPGPLLGPAHRWAAAVGVVGLVAAAFAAGYLAGTRTSPPRRS